MISSELDIDTRCPQKKCPRFRKWLRFSKSRFATFLNSAGRQKWPALATSNQWVVVDMSLRVGYIAQMGNEFKAYINCSGKYGYITVFYLVNEGN